MGLHLFGLVGLGGPCKNKKNVEGVLHCQHGQWGLEAMIPWWLRRGCATENPEARFRASVYAFGSWEVLGGSVDSTKDKPCECWTLSNPEQIEVNPEMVGNITCSREV